MKGWHRESYRHSLAARGIPSKMDLRLTNDSAMKWLRTSAIEHSLTPELETLFLSAEDPEELNNLMKKYETEMANNRNRYVGYDWGPYLVCDEAVEIMSYILKRKGIDHEVLMGFSDTADTHVWLRVNNINYDPTEQGMHEGQIIAKWDDRKGKSEHFSYLDVDFDDEKAYWNAVVVIDGEEENRRLVK